MSAELDTSAIEKNDEEWMSVAVLSCRESVAELRCGQNLTSFYRQ